MKPLLLACAAILFAGCTGATLAPESTVGDDAVLPAPRSDTPLPVVVEGAPPGSIPPPRPFPTIYMKGGFVTTPEVHAIVGEQVVWRNEDSDAHHEIVDDAGFFTRQVIEAGAWWGHAYDAPNTYLYHCLMHPDVAGRVVVS